jgi:hypothetical protein
MRYWLLLVVLCCLPLVSAYEVGVPLDIKVKLQFDDGVSLLDVVDDVCIVSIYFAGNESLVVRDVQMSGGAYHNVTFFPSAVGEYTVSVRCVYGNESVSYYEDFQITPVIVGSPSGGGGVLNLNAKIIPERKSVVVDLSGGERLSLGVQYSVGGRLVDSGVAGWRLVREDRVLASGSYVSVGQGSYRLEYDVSGLFEGSYQLFLDFDGRTEIVDVLLVRRVGGVSLLSGMVVGGDGRVSFVRSSLALLVLLFVIMVLFLASKRSRK